MPLAVLKRGDAIPETFARSIYLVAADGEPWESDLVSALENAELRDGVVFVGDDVPEPDGNGWRARATSVSDAIVCYVQPDAVGSSAMSAYVATEIVRWVTTGQMFCAAPEGSWADELCAKAPHKIVPERSLEGLVAKVAKALNVGAERNAAERLVPLMIWRTPSWKLWYDNLLEVGNRLDGASVDWTFRVGPGGVFTLFWAVHANIWVESEGRNKSNEVVIARPDVCCTLAYVPGQQLLDTEIIVIKEFRSPCRNEHGFVYELPGGSSFKPQSDVYQTAAEELFEETGIRVEKTRLRKEMSRQAAATVTTHHVHLFSVELTSEEMGVAKKCAEERTMFGNAEETEQTYIETLTLRDAIPAAKLDFSTLGMIMQSIGIFYDSQQAKEDQEMVERLKRIGLAAGLDVNKEGLPAEGEPPTTIASSDIGKRSTRKVESSTVAALDGVHSRSERSSNSSAILDSLEKSMSTSEDLKLVLVKQIVSLEAEVAALKRRAQQSEPEPEPQGTIDE